MLKVLVILLAICYFNNEPVYCFDNEPDGFRGIKFGTHLSQVPPGSVAREEGGVLSYRRTNEELNIANVKVESIEYLFYKNRFYMVRIRAYTPGSEGSPLKSGSIPAILLGGQIASELQYICEAKYGKCLDVNEGKAGETNTWSGKYVEIRLFYLKITGDVILCFTYKPIFEELLRDRKNAAPDPTK